MAEGQKLPHRRAACWLPPGPAGQIAVATRQKSTARRLVSAAWAGRPAGHGAAVLSGT